ncbi:MAG: YicC family protein, partial [Candidatus Cloacimonetes bacterium HGW-Cloacimonetes-1]
HREPKVRLNEVKLKKYYEIVNKAVNILNLDQKIGVEFLLNEPGVIENANNLEEDEDLKVLLDSAISQALVKIDESMSTEGEGIQTVLVESMEQISLAVGSIEGTLEDYRSDLFSSMNKRISELLTNHKMDNMEQRLVQELAIYIDKYDVQEEITRLHSHIETFRNTIKQGDNSDIGKTLNFIVQEMLREANTLGSKYSTSQSFKYILSIKEEIEKCREIVQNVS